MAAEPSGGDEGGDDMVGDAEVPSLRVFEIDGACVCPQYVEVVKEVVDNPLLDDVAVSAAQDRSLGASLFASDALKGQRHAAEAVYLPALVDGEYVVGYRVVEFHSARLRA